MRLLTIESTCDETAAAIVTDELQVLGACVASQESLHERYQGVVPEIAARVMDLQRPNDKMSKTAAAENGLIYVLEDPKSIEKKFKRAVTDSDDEVRLDWDHKPGVSNLLEILSAATGTAPQDLADQYTQYGALKVDTAAAVIEMVRPIQERFAELEADPAETMRVLQAGADKASEIASAVYDRARTAIGLL